MPCSYCANKQSVVLFCFCRLSFTFLCSVFCFCRCSPIQRGFLGGNTPAPNGIIGVGLGSLSLLKQAQDTRSLAHSFAYCRDKSVFFRSAKVFFGRVVFNRPVTSTDILQVRDQNSNARYHFFFFFFFSFFFFSFFYFFFLFSLLSGGVKPPRTSFKSGTKNPTPGNSHIRMWACMLICVRNCMLVYVSECN